MNMSPTRNRLIRLQRTMLYVAIVLLLSIVTAQLTVRAYFLPNDNSNEIEIYTTTWCGYCRQLREFLMANTIPFRETDIEMTMRGALAAYALQGKGVPFSTIGPHIYYELNQEAIAEAVTKLGHEVKVPFGQ